jgi:hypothetical protein
VAAGLANCAFRSAFEVHSSGVAKSARFSDALDEVFAAMEAGFDDLTTAGGRSEDARTPPH